MSEACIDLKWAAGWTSATWVLSVGRLRTVLEQGEILVQTRDVNQEEKDEKSDFSHVIYKFGDYKMHVFSAAFSLSILADPRDVIAKLKSIKTYLRPL